MNTRSVTRQLFLNSLLVFGFWSSTLLVFAETLNFELACRENCGQTSQLGRCMLDCIRKVEETIIKKIELRYPNKNSQEFKEALKNYYENEMRAKSEPLEY